MPAGRDEVLRRQMEQLGQELRLFVKNRRPSSEVKKELQAMDDHLQRGELEASIQAAKRVLSLR